MLLKLFHLEKDIEVCHSYLSTTIIAYMEKQTVNKHLLIISAACLQWSNPKTRILTFYGESIHSVQNTGLFLQMASEIPTTINSD